ncbi:MAG: hypothetical protein C7B45_02340 [Sulfobacillus acidophilus]|uniref:Uncharacterized protein n=1 Tax=Sulfobacillus acidophilus TaxID=53633 RepID=A0A2T2WN22_9FIRM|nr:MAG: hypothetical protein C7B45_02340 [Sulfobacillus acidophilus]
MSQPLIWMPTLDLRQMPDPLATWTAKRFLQSHAGIGHIVASGQSVIDGPSIEVSDPSPGLHWYCTQARKVPKKLRPLDVSVAVPVPTGALDPILHVLESAKAAGPIRRLVLYRPPQIALSRIVVSINTLLDTITPSIWIDAASFGWNAVSYLIAASDQIQVHGVSDQDLWRLSQIAQWLNRRLVLQDLSPRPPRVLPPPLQWSHAKDPAKVLKTLPVWERSR